MNNQIQLVLKSSTTELSLNDHELGIYLTPELDGLTGLPEIRTTSGVNAGYDGGWTSAQNYDARSITIRGVIANENVATVEQLRRQLTTLAGQGKNEELTLDLVTQGGKAYTIQVRTIALEMALQKVLCQQEFMLQLRADDPLIYDGGSSGESVIVQVQKAIGGFQIDFELPLAISGGSGESTINNGGLEQVYPIIKMYGALHNPTFVNQTTNQQFEVNATLGFAEGAWHTPSELYEGTTINIPDAPDNAPLASFQLDGETSQTTYTGKNLFNKNANTGAFRASKSVSGEEITITSTSAGNGYVAFVIPNSNDLLGKTCTISIKNITSSVSGAKGAFAIYQAKEAEPAAVGGFVTNGEPTGQDYSKTFTFPGSFSGSSDCFAILLYPNSLGGSIAVGDNTKYSNIQIEVGGTPTSFEPYVGGVPAPNPDYPQAVQTVTGENVVKICGKNLADINSNLRSSSNGLVFTANSDGSFTMAGTTTTTWANITNDFNTNLPAGEYTFSIGAVLTHRVYLHCVLEDGSSTDWAINPGFTSVSRTFTSGIKTIRLDVSMMTSGQAYNETIKVQLELGSPASQFEPYQGQSYEINLGKNLYNSVDGTASSSGITVTRSGGLMGISGTVTDSWGFNIEPGNTAYTQPLAPGVYTVSINKVVNFNVKLNFKKADGYSPVIATIPAGSRSTTVTISDTIVYHTLWSDSTTGTVVDVQGFGVQVEKGSQATSYAAYFEPIELCKIGDYQDYIYKDGSDWKIHKACAKYRLDSTKTWYVTGTTNYQCTLASSDRIYLALSAKGYSNYFRVASSGTDIYMYPVLQGNTDYVRISNAASKWAASSDLTTFLANNEVYLYYPLADSAQTDTEITNEALIAQLEAVLGGRTYAGTNNITTITPNEQGTLEISYMTEKDADKRDVMVIDSRMRTVTLNGADIYHLIAAGSEFPMLAPGENKLLLRSDTPGDNGYADVNYKQGYLTI